MKRLFQRTVIIIAFLAASALILGCAGTRKREKNREREAIKIEAENKLQVKDERNLEKLIKTLRQTDRFSTSSMANLEIYPIDPNRPASVTEETTPTGGKKTTFNNAGIRQKTTETTEKTTDSAAAEKRTRDRGQLDIDQGNKLAGEKDTDNKQLHLLSKKNNWIWQLGVGLGIVALLYFNGKTLLSNFMTLFKRK